VTCPACGQNAECVRAVESHYQFYVHRHVKAEDSSRVVVTGCRVVMQSKTVEVWNRRVLRDAMAGQSPRPGIAARGPIEARP